MQTRIIGGPRNTAEIEHENEYDISKSATFLYYQLEIQLVVIK